MGNDFLVLRATVISCGSKYNLILSTFLLSVVSPFVAVISSIKLIDGNGGFQIKIGVGK